MADLTRRAQLIAPFGVGALSVLKNGTAVLTAGLDSWFTEDGVERNEFEISELRLAASLGVQSLYEPPDFRPPWAHYDVNERRNVGLEVPFLLFPRWHVCPRCRRMLQLPLHHNATGRGATCPHHEDIAQQWRRPRVQQVRFLVMCESGHVQDFPWREWVHRSTTPTCNGNLFLRTATGASLSAIWVLCEGCEMQRNLAGIMHASPNGDTALSGDLAKRERFTCSGYRPWLGENREGCGRDLRATLRSATNVHFGRVRSAIFLPPEATPTSSASRLVESLLAQFRVNAGFRSVYDSMRQAAIELESRHAYVKQFVEANGEPGWTRQQVIEAIKQVDDALSKDEGTSSSPVPSPDDATEWSETSFRQDEFTVLSTEVSTDELVIKMVDRESYGSVFADRSFSEFFDDVSLVHKLRETRAYFGFSRVKPDERVSVENARRMLARDSQPWLPANVVRGEGIFLRLSERALEPWERSIVELGRLRPIQAAFAQLHAQHRVGVDVGLTPRLVLLHTLAHALINRLVFDCGYGSASLRERLYVSTEPDTRMAGLLIYTAAGDAEGTMGGLVEMGQPGRLERVVRRALEAATWCSLDPVCMEVGQRQGQGPDSCNLAACHSCALLPETSCEQFNRFLDRGLLVGESSTGNGFFSQSV